MDTLTAPSSGMNTNNLTKILFLLILAAILVGIFWMGSRYPDLNSKAMMGGNTQIDALGFDTIMSVSPDASTARKILATSVNWMYTNWRGMTFGLLLAGLIMTLLPLLPQSSKLPAWTRGLQGVFIGAPLGVCVNCATPIAQGLALSGSNAAVALSALVSSPTLNVVVLTMTFTLLPFHLAATKLVLSVLVALVVIPLVVHFLGPKTVKIPQNIGLPYFTASGSSGRLGTARSNVSSIIDVSASLARNLWRIFWLAVPLMLLAGFLGAILVTVVPFAELADFFQVRGRFAIFMAICLLAVVGLFLPVPMAFDVVITIVLLNAGLSGGFAMTLLFSLGIFSIYPFMVIWRSISLKLAVALAVSLFGLSAVAGVAGHVLSTQIAVQEANFLRQNVGQNFAPKGSEYQRPAGVDSSVLMAQLNETRLDFQNIETNQNVSIEAVPFKPRTGDSKQMFEKLSAFDMGFREGPNFSHLRSLLPHSVSRGVATGDVHNDGWPDVLIASETGIGLYANRAGEKFELQQIHLPKIDNLFTSVVALVDLNGDGWLDIFVSAMRGGTFIVYNEKGDFNESNMVEVGEIPDLAATQSVAFGDLNKNGNLEIVIGQSVGINNFYRSAPELARNRLLRRVGDTYETETFDQIPGETLTLLISDLNNDSWPDLMVGNDYKPEDQYYLSDKKGNLIWQPKKTEFVSRSTHTTMSAVTADIDNDLSMELFLGQIGRDGTLTNTQGREVDICASLSNRDHKSECENWAAVQSQMNKADRGRDLSWCRNLKTNADVSKCVAAPAVFRLHASRSYEQCITEFANWPDLVDGCKAAASNHIPPSKEKLAEQFESKLSGNILAKRNSKGTYDEIPGALGLEFTDWMWTGKFADVNNDEWQDIFIGAGIIHGASLLRPDRLFMNRGGKSFEDVSQNEGMRSWLPTVSYSYLDFDFDGDLDIITAAGIGPLQIYRNSTQNGQAIEIELNDRIGNRFGIGSKIIIRYGDGKHQVRELLASGGFASFDAPTAHFGLGTHTYINEIEVQWSTGKTTLHRGDFKAGQKYKLTRRAFD